MHLVDRLEARLAQLDHELHEARARHKAAEADVETREMEIERLRKRSSSRCAISILMYEECFQGVLMCFYCLKCKLDAWKLFTTNLFMTHTLTSSVFRQGEEELEYQCSRSVQFEAL